MEEYQLEGTIGFGSFSVVKKARHLATGKHFAVKIVTPEAGKAYHEEDDHLLVYDRHRIEREIGHWRTFEHPNLCHLRSVIETDGKVAFVMDFAEGGDLLQYLMSKRELDLLRIQSYFKQLCLAVQYLHDMGLVHGDIKLENILLIEVEEADPFCYKKVLLSDFGLTRKPPDESLVNCGTIEYAAPELISSDFEGCLVDPFKSDIWALGVVLFALYFRKFPFDAPNSKVMKGRILHHEPDYGGHADGCVIELLHKLLRKQPGDRPCFDEIFGCKFFDFRF